MKLHPDENFSCRQKIFESLMAQRLQYPINGGYVYSDISMITGMFVAGKIARTRGYVRYETLDAACAAGLDRNSPLYAFISDFYHFGSDFAHSLCDLALTSATTRVSFASTLSASLDFALPDFAPINLCGRPLFPRGMTPATAT
jgi:hypothetical protein